MGRKKMQEEREYEIRTLHNEIQAHVGSNCAAVDTLERKLRTRLNAWYEVIKENVIICVAQNEQSPWTEEEIGYKTHPMFKRSEIGLYQVGDYQIAVNKTNSLYDSFSSLLVERKGCTYSIDGRGCSTMIGCDLYSTLMNSSNHNRFIQEIERFQNDERFGRMCVIVECSYSDFLRFKPPFNGKSYNKLNGGASRESRIGAVNSLFVRYGCHVVFAGSRANAIESYRNMIRQSVIYDYTRFISGCEQK